MRKLMWFGVGFGAACALGVYLLSDSAALILGLCLFLCGVGLLFRFRQIGWQRAAGFLTMGLAIGFLWLPAYSGVVLSPLQSVDGQKKHIEAEITDYSYSTQYGAAAQARLKLEGRTVKCKVYLDDPMELAPGDRVWGEFLLRYTGPEGEADSDYLSGTGVFLLCYQQDVLTVEQGEGGALTHFPARLRRSITRLIEQYFPADTAPFAKALLLGDTTDLTYDTRADLTASGIVHIVAVSGMHVSILLCVVYLVLGRRKILTPLIGFGIVLLAAAVTGFSPSIVRACLMNALMLLALMLDRQYDPLTALAFAVVVMLGLNPLAVTSVGLQLSVASVLGINLFCEPIADWLRSRGFWAGAKRKSLLHRLREWIAPSVAVTLAATLTTAPLTALHFGTVSLVGWLTNLLVMWLINFLFIGMIVSVILGSLWSWGAGSLAWLLSWPVRYVLFVAKILGGFPLASVYTESVYITVWLICAYGMLAVFLLLKRKRRLQLCVWTAALLVIALAFSYLEPRLDSLRITVLDVGQGQCVLLQSQGRSYLVDCGGSDDEVAAEKAIATLYSQGIFTLDGLILTHYDRDHVGGAQYLLSRMEVKQLYLPVGPGQTQWEAVLTGETGAEVIFVREDRTLEWSGAKLQIFSSHYGETSNESSLCVLFQKENYDILITGDRGSFGEMLLLAEHEIPRLDALVLGHHGSGSSTGEYLLQRTQPELALISVGADNRYGHPAQAVLERLEAYGCIVRRTDLEGTIVIRR